MFRSPPAQAQLEQFRSNRDDQSCDLHDLEKWLRGKLAIVRRMAKRGVCTESAARVERLSAMAAEVKSARFDTIARRCSLPRMSVFG